MRYAQTKMTTDLKGESISLKPQVYLQFWAEKGTVVV
jgi:D-lyxose ketol-isomerase